MTIGVQLSRAGGQELDAAVCSETVLNAYEVVNLSDLSWPVRVLTLEHRGGPIADHERGKLTSVVWDLRNNNKAQCPGLGFVVDVDRSRVAVPVSWQIPAPVEAGEYRVTQSTMMDADVTTSTGRVIVTGILRESVKSCFRNTLPELGPLWQDFGSFTQAPSPSAGEEYLLCRRFTAQVKMLREKRLAVQVVVGSTALDGKTFEQHYRDGTVADLAEMISCKRAGRTNRKNQPVSVRVVQQFPNGTNVRALDLDDIDSILQDSKLKPEQQKARSGRTVRCHPFARPALDVPIGELRLILDSQILGEDHSETIIEPEERMVWMERVRKAVDGANAYGKTLQLSSEPLQAGIFGITTVLPPAIRVRGNAGHEVTIEPPDNFTESQFRDRAKKRAEHIRRNGFLDMRPINPILAWPSRLGESRGQRMKSDLEEIWSAQGIKAGFELISYKSAEDIYQAVQRGKHDALLAVLPEGSDAPQVQGSMHESIKRRIQVPSQCMQHNHTLPARLAGLDARAAAHTDPQRVRRVRRMYEGCLSALLVKHHCFPFAPADPFHYNVQVGLDVGGVHNTHVMACLGYGFRSPKDGLFFLPEEIPVEVQKKEPIPTESLYVGLLSSFEKIHGEISAVGGKPDFDSIVFYRDGQLLGDGDEWNERDALRKLHREMLSRGWVGENSLWTAVELLKAAEGWRMIRREGSRVLNPLVGQVCFPFADDRIALVATTGEPYLTQGTAQPLIARISDISGKADVNNVIRDLVWQADMGFTKVDMGMSLPWVLYVADQGALQLSRSYRITGITV